MCVCVVFIPAMVFTLYFIVLIVLVVLSVVVFRFVFSSMSLSWDGDGAV